MPDTVSHSSLIREARREIRALKRPAGVRSDSWRSVLELLHAIAGYLPDPYPSQRVLARKLGIRQRTVCDQVARAVRWGLLVTVEHPNPGGLMPGTSYRLVCLTMPLQVAITRGANQRRIPLQRKISYSVGDQTDPPIGGSSSAGAARQGAEVIQMPNRWTEDNDDGVVIGAPHPDIGPPVDPVGQQSASTRVNPGTYLARRFTSKWAAAKRRAPALRVTRALDPGPASGYINKTMLGTNGLSPEHVEAYMDAFIDAAIDGSVIIEEGQFAFQRFIPWWGRTDVEDPTERLASKKLAADAVEAVRRWRAEQGLTGA